jgi:hypothetical protein
VANKINQHRKGIEDAAGITRQAANKRIANGQDGESFQLSKERKEKATADLREEQAVKARIEREILQGSVVTKESVRSDGQKVAAIWCAEINSFRNNAPGKLAGLDEVGVRLVLDAECDLLIENILREMDRIK